MQEVLARKSPELVTQNYPIPNAPFRNSPIDPQLKVNFYTQKGVELGPTGLQPTCWPSHILGAHLRAPALKTENFSLKLVVLVSRTQQKWSF